MKTNVRDIRSRKTRGEFNYVTPIVIVLLVVAIWAGKEFIPAYYQKAQLSTDLSGLLISSRRIPNEEATAMIFNYFKAAKDIELEPADVIFTKTPEAPNLVSASVSYRRIVHIPFRDEPYKISLSVESHQDFTLVNSIN